MNEESMDFEDDIVSVDEEGAQIIDISEESILSKGGRFLLYAFLINYYIV